MPPAYQRRRTREIKEREERRKIRELENKPTMPDTTVAAPVDTYEVRVPYSDHTKWPRESKFRKEWPTLHERLGYKFSEMEQYIERNRRLVVVPGHSKAAGAAK